MMNYESRGFTIIELLVVISLGMIIATGGLAGYMNFSRSQMLVQASRGVIADLRLAQSLAENNQKPSGCSTLSKYSFQVLSETSYRIFATCGEKNPVEYDYKEDSIPAGLSMSGFSQIDFKVLKQGLSSAGGGYDLTISGFNKERKINVSQGGVIKLSNE